MLDVHVFEVNGFLSRERVKNALEQGPVLVAIHPLLVYPGLHFLEFETGERVEGEPEPVPSFYHKITNEETFCCTGQVEYSNHVVHF